MKSIISTKSNFFENAIEHRFISDTILFGWNNYQKEVGLLRCEVDNAGFDLVFKCDGVFRFIQLKSSGLNSKRSYQKFNTALLENENPCIVWVQYAYNFKRADIDQKYLFWGSDVGKSAPDISHYSIPKGKKSASGEPKLLLNVRNIPRGAFIEVSADDLFRKLFFQT
ncbi:MAG: hypothetical protein LBC77_01690 [Spirochaetaceae bacterium]|jgi:hypothetical protein|nr:hypothetical protein [Spirochaetaceae bacterium]